MTESEIRRKVDALSSDDGVSRADKIAGLMQIYLDACALQRAANEGGMIAENPQSADDLSHAEKALRRFGVEAADVKGGNAASL